MYLIELHVNACLHVYTYNVYRRIQSPGDGLVHQLVHGLEAHGALDETVDSELVVQQTTGALAGAWPGSCRTKSRNCLRCFSSRYTYV